MIDLTTAKVLPNRFGGSCQKKHSAIMARTTW